MLSLTSKTGMAKNVFLDNFVFRLNYRWTVVLLISCSLIVTCQLFLGNSFSCKSIVGIEQSFLETKCYADGVYMSQSQLNKTHQDPVAKPTSENTGRGFRRYQNHYSWVNLLLLVHAFSFYLPHLLWTSYESGSTSRLTSDLDNSDINRNNCIGNLARYICKSHGKHRLFFWIYIFCEICNYCVCLSHTLWLVHFFDVTGVPESIYFNIKTWSDFQLFYFPSSGHCTFTFAKERYHGICLLPLNRLYMAMFLVIHAWYICLTIATGVVLVYRICLLSSSFRFKVLHFLSPLSDMETLKTISYGLSYTDWFYIIRFQRLMTDIDFEQLLAKMVSNFTKSPSDDRKERDKLSLSLGEDKKETESLVDESDV